MQHLSKLIKDLEQHSKEPMLLGEIFENFVWKDVLPKLPEHADYGRFLIHRTELYEVILMKWDNQQKTPIHSHNEQDCWTYMLEGELKETLFDQTTLKIKDEMIVSRNMRTYIHDSMGVHQVENLSKKSSLSLHLYAKPLPVCHFYDMASGLWKESPLTITCNL